MLKNKMIVSSLGGEMNVRHVCSGLNLNIRGVDPSTNLIVLESRGIDVIHGMDWLTKYKGIIDCARKVIKLTLKDGTQLEYVADAPVTSKEAVN